MLSTTTSLLGNRRRLLIPSSCVLMLVGLCGCSAQEQSSANRSSTTQDDAQSKKSNVDSPESLKAPFSAESARTSQAGWAQYLGTPVIRKNAIGMQFALIPPGEYTFGVTNDQRETAPGDWFWHIAADHESYVHERIREPFYLGMHEVTRGQFARFVDATGYHSDAEAGLAKGRGYDITEHAFVGSDEYSWRRTGFENGNNHPVVNVTPRDAARFCDWLSEQPDEKRGRWIYRLPTEVEWEYACRAGTQSIFPTGDSPGSLRGAGNYVTESRTSVRVQWAVPGNDDGYRYTAPVGRFESNAWGLFDMSGNVDEICVADLRLSHPVLSNGHASPDETQADVWVFRGGSYCSGFRMCLTAYRGYVPRRDYVNHNIGFRVLAIRSLADGDADE